MPPARPGAEPALVRIRWRQAWRIIASRYPPINLYETLTDDPAIWDALIALEEATNPRLRDAIGQLALVPPEDRVSGPGASWVMAAFTHVNPAGSRFSDGSYGVYYAADRLAAAICETVHHFEAFARDAADPVREEDMRVLVGSIDADFHDVLSLDAAEQTGLLHAASYGASRIFAMGLREQDSPGLHYPSVRAKGARCIAAFKPRSVGIPHQERHLRYRWNGTRVDRYFDFREDRWVDIPATAPPEGLA